MSRQADAQAGVALLVEILPIQRISLGVPVNPWINKQAGFDESPNRKKGSVVGMVCGMYEL